MQWIAPSEKTPAQIGFLANLVRLHRGEGLDLALGGTEAEAKEKDVFGKKPKYADVPGLCRARGLEQTIARNVAESLEA